ncbi:Transcriptional regulatory protein LiaR [compost metagenome]
MVCTINEEDDSIFEALKAGANSYIVKKSKPYQIIDAIMEVFDGEMPISSCIATKILNYMPQSTEEEDKPEEEVAYSITLKEAELLELLAKGHSYREISNAMAIKITTIKWHVYNIYKKLQAKNRTEAINKYFK